MATDARRYPPVVVKVWGPYACFTRPEAKVERVSYDVLTPSAARNILESIVWKPQFEWEIRQIAVLNPIQHASIRRNEVKQRASYKQATQWMDQGHGGFFADDDDIHTQRHTLALKNVSYLIWADVAVQPGVDVDPAKYRDQLRRRLESGQCYRRPYLGLREFAADFGLPDGTERPQDLSRDLGKMLFDLRYERDGSGRGTPLLFEARLEHGILHVSPELYQQRLQQAQQTA